jgi:SAM-dependent methyltransferase
MQRKQEEWKWQWQKFDQANKWLFQDWIYPQTLEYFRNKTVLDAGCGGGHHLRFVAPYAKHIHALDLNAVEVARERNPDLKNVTFVEGDICSYDPGIRFDVVYSIGVVHHTDDPNRTVAHLKTLLKSGGRLILWVYSKEGNFLNEYGLEPLKKYFFLRIPKKYLLRLSSVLSMLLYPIIYTIYLLPLKRLPYYEYFQNWRQLSYLRNKQNVFDKLNAPQTFFIPKSQGVTWLSDLHDTHISRYRGVSWRLSGSKLLSSHTD